MEIDMKKDDHAEAMVNKVKKKNAHHLHDQLQASVLDTSMTGYEVVLSFSRDQSGIIKPLTAKMLNLGINVFRNVEKVHDSGNQIDEDFSLAIDSCKICIPILSNEYLSREGCLHELAYIAEARRNSDDMQILPLFYDVDPCEVNLHYTNSMPEYMDINDTLRVQRWQETLEEVAEIKGWEMKDKDFNKYINLIVNGILSKLKPKHSAAGSVGMEDQIKKVMSLHVESGGVLFVGIHGASGVGKTTLAKVIFNELVDQFEGCSFLHDIRETSENWGLKYLQDKLLRDISNKESNGKEIKRMKERLLNKKVLIVLDDVIQREQINNLVGKGSWFGAGSKIIVTTQDPRVLAVEHDTTDGILKWPQEVRTCELRGLMVHAPSLAVQLFCRHAFGEDSPPNGYQDISISLVEAIGGLPLALEIIGSFLNHKSKDVWDSTLERLSQIPHLEVKEKLLISYESLEYETKQIFLDIACFFCKEDKTYPVYMWDACNFFPRQGLEVLKAMCLVKITDDNKLWMHDQVKDFGREMARLESFNMGLAQCSRLWVDQEALDVLIRTEGDVKDKMEVEALSLGCNESLLDWTFTNESFGRTPHLRFLELQGAHLAGTTLWSGKARRR